MKVEEKPIDSIIPYENNPRIHNDEQINRIANSIAEFGFNQPIVVDENNIILVGHGRLEAAKKLGHKTVPVVRKEKLTESQKKAYRIIDNKLQNDSEWNHEALELDIVSLGDLAFDIESYGLDSLIIKPDILDRVDLPGEERETDASRTFTLTVEQAEIVDRAVGKMSAAIPNTDGNRNGESITEICKWFLRQ